MSDGALQDNRTEAAMPLPDLTTDEAAGDAFSAALDRLTEAAREVRAHMLDGKLQLGADAVSAITDLAAAVDELDAAEAQLVHDAFEGPDAPAFDVTTHPWWREGFTAGAAAQLEAARLYAARRGWPSVSAALESFPHATPPAANPAAAPEVVTTMPGGSHEA